MEGGIHMVRLIKIICVILLLCSSFISAPLGIEHSEFPYPQIASGNLDSGVQVTNSVITLKFVFLTVFLYFIVRANSVLSSIIKIKQFLRPIVYIMIMRGLLSPVKFQSRFIVQAPLLF